MKKRWFAILAFGLILSACSGANAAAPTATQALAVAPTNTPFTSVTSTATTIPVTDTPQATATPSYPAEGRGPTGFAADIDPLTGLQVSDPSVLERRPIVIKVENMPREHRPQWGVSLADLVYEYYTEFGTTRFATVFYGNNAERVGPIRSGRFFDANVVQMYKSTLVYGSAYEQVNNRFFNSDFANRLILETQQSCPGLCRFDSNGQNLLVANTTALFDYIKSRNIDNSRQNLDGMLFKADAPATGDDATQVFVRFSGAVYNRWDYDTNTKRYLRFSDTQNDVNQTNEVYAQLTDRLTNNPIAVDNLVTLCIPHQYFVKRDDAEVIDIIMDDRIPSYTGCDGQTYSAGTGPAYIARDGKIYKVTWKREKQDSVLTLMNPDGSVFPFKPGQTWFEVVGASSSVESKGSGVWRFTHHMVP